MAIDGFWISILGAVLFAVAIGIGHQIDERRYRREAAEDEAANKAAE